MSKHKSKKTRRDVAEIARENLEKIIGEKLTGEPLDKPESDTRNPAAVALGRLGGLKGGKARAKKLSKKRQSEIGKTAARARWKKSSE